MKLRSVPPDKIKVPEVRVTARFDSEMWEQFQSSIKQSGAIAPIICMEVDGELVLVDGLHRLVEAKKNGDQHISVAVIPGDEVDVLTKNLFLDHVRGKTPVSEMVNVIEVLTRDYGLDSEQIASKTGLTRDYVEKLQRLSELTPACRASLDEGKIGVGQAFELTKIKDPVTQETVLHQLELYRWTIPALKEYISDVLTIQEKAAEAPPGGQPAVDYKIECFYCHRKFDITEIANPHTCRQCTFILLSAIAEAERQLRTEGEPQKDGV